MEEDFKSVRWEDNDNTAIVSLKNDDKEYAIFKNVNIKFYGK